MVHLYYFHCIAKEKILKVDGDFCEDENSRESNCGKPNISVVPLFQGDKVVPAEET